MPSGVYKRTAVHRAKLAEIARNRPSEVNEKIAETLRQKMPKGVMPAHFTEEQWRTVQEKGWEANRGRSGEKVANWKGDQVGATALSQWIVYHKGKPFGCEVCGTQEPRMYYWTSRSGQRLRDLNDWMSICVRCRRLQQHQVPWNKGKKTGPLLKARHPKRPHENPTRFKKGQSAPNKGQKMLAITGEKHPAWKGGITKISHKIRTSLEYKQWRQAVLERDNFTCVLCGYVSGKPRDMRADHIKPFHLYPDLRFEVSNGRALCVPCDHKHGWQVWNKNRETK